MKRDKPACIVFQILPSLPCIVLCSGLFPFCLHSWHDPVVLLISDQSICCRSLLQTYCGSCSFIQNIFLALVIH